MNTWGYLILIAALLLLAAAMLYARFASRSREKSLHHSPVELMFPADTISAARPLENETGKIDLPRGKKAPEIKVDRVVPPTVTKDGVKGESKKRESDYFDDLQEAAAGLAMLMRSSPVGRTEPVVYAPEEDKVEAETETAVEAETAVEEVSGAIDADFSESVEEVPEIEIEVASESCFALDQLAADILVEEVAIEEEIELEVESELIVEEVAIEGEIDLEIESELIVERVATEEEIELEVESELIVEEVVAPVEEPEECEVSLLVEVRVLTMREILGDQVSDRIEQIDEGLDALEALVRNIESSLRALDSVDLIDEDEELADADGTIVSEAA